MSLITYSEFRGVPAPITDEPNRFTIIRLDCPLDSSTHDLEVMTERLIEQNYGVLLPRETSWWFKRTDAPIGSDSKSERDFFQMVSEYVRSTGPKRLALLGGEAALRMAFCDPVRFPIVATWDGLLDFHELHGQGTDLDRIFERKEQARQETAILRIRPDRSPSAIWFGCSDDSPRYQGHDRLHEKLSAVGVPHQFVCTQQLPIDELLDFFVSHERKKALRLL